MALRLLDIYDEAEKLYNSYHLKDSNIHTIMVTHSTNSRSWKSTLKIF